MSTLGVIRDLSRRYIGIKKRINEFTDVSSQSYSTMTNKQKNLRNEKFIDSNQDSEESIKPDNQIIFRYNGLYDQCIASFKDFEHLFSELKEEQQKRNIPNFNETDIKLRIQKIEKISEEMTTKLRKCQEIITQIKREIAPSAMDNDIKNNMYNSLLIKFTECTLKLKENEENYIRKFDELNSGEEALFESMNSTKDYFTDVSYDNKKYDRIKARNQEIDGILKTVKELGDMFRNAQSLVLYGGTILDRIDFDINSSRLNVLKGNEKLSDAAKSLESSCVRRANYTLLIAIFIMGVLILFKFFK